jgi:membrane protease YdiL (CAAX protease family)
LKYTSWAKNLFSWFSQVLGPLRLSEAMLLAAFSATGEELLFRGALQPHLGLWPTTLIFALLHLPPRWCFWPWTAMAGVLGLGLGLITQRTGNLAGCMLAHFLINGLNLSHLSRLLPPAPNPEPSPVELVPPSDSTMEPPQEKG